ncbi:hypothetical protein TanjilG_07992 [Lupinus angustifolius]|uniref:BHLH domain-containing protein n=1 Tax=Lupinus angustifolius TaxID=3871 RepID=A0A4P1RLK3_LUPAN|nr:PREDICTED: transcription factor bHLH19-like [Lupinus angustifolius]XP_019440323.1 PREDICTED: transcription factor bHLH19-like [Lupinus angustifolius]OIW13650.1 hypothetical protein TanjilG_07992 [Lupinus angustifolius]
MEISSIIGLPELGIMEDPNFFNQWNISSIDATSLLAGSSFGETLQKSSISNSNSNPKTCMESERPAKQFKSNWNNNRNPQTSEAQFASNYSNLLSFVDSNYYTSQLGLVRPKMDMVCPKVESKIAQEAFGHQNFVFQDFHEGKMIGARPKHSTPHEHVLAERKRREKLSQRFIDLSALVPGLKKMDKASVLGDAIKYLKQMQEKVSSLEEEKNRKKTAESVVFVKKSILSNSDDLDTGGSFDEALPEIEARVWERNVLIRVHCEKKKGVIEKTISEIEKLHLKVINTSALAFGSFVLDITIIAQMEVEFSMTVKDLVIELRSAFASFM